MVILAATCSLQSVKKINRNPAREYRASRMGFIYYSLVERGRDEIPAWVKLLVRNRVLHGGLHRTGGCCAP